MIFVRQIVGAVALGLVSTAAFATDPGNVESGEKIFKKCATCHVVEDAKNKIGPTLNGVIGRTPGTVEDYKYSKAMTKFGKDHVWDDATLTDYLANPRKVVKGTKMAFAGLRKDQEIADVIAYLKTFSE